MDRLVCGDVGFGKTEVAVRAVFKAVQDGNQAAVLVPTTLLAQQHFQTFSERYAPYPVRVEMLSRFLTAARRAKVVEGLADGSVDVVIGTHRLLGPDVRFKRPRTARRRRGAALRRLPQRGHRRQLTVGVDVLTLTASPIPRTFEMSLTGIRDLSLIDTPPAERQPILTYVGEHDERAVAEAIRRELLARGPGLLRPQPRPGHRACRKRPAGARPRGQDRGRPRPDGRGQPRAGRARLLGGRLRRARLHDHHRVGDRHADGQHARRRPRRPARARSAAPAARPGRAGRPGGRTRTSSSPATGCSPSRPTSACARSASTPSSGPGSRSRCATSRSAAPATCSAATSPATSRPSATTCTSGMVAEAVAELKGEPIREPAEINARPAGRRAPAGRLRRARGPPPRGLPAARRGPRPGGGRRHRGRSGSTATARCPPEAEALLVGRRGCAPSACGPASPR